MVEDVSVFVGKMFSHYCLGSEQWSILIVEVRAAVTLVSDAVNQTFCDGENVVWNVDPPIAGATNYRFLQKGIITIQNGNSVPFSNRFWPPKFDQGNKHKQPSSKKKSILFYA